MSQIGQIWANLTPARRGMVVAATGIVFAAVLVMSRMAAQPSLSLLYSGLDGAAAGEVITALETQGVAYEVRGTAIFVDSAARDSLRLTLASEGLPSNSTLGYELLDGLSGFATTSQMFDAAYWRAKEGELARTIQASPLVRAARVHVSAGGGSTFRAPRQATASVTVTTEGGKLGGAQVRAIQYLVSAAVAGLLPENVAVIDSSGGLLSAREEGSAGTEEVQALAARVERMLEARVGPGNVVVELTIDRVRDREQIRERVIDPESRVAISADVTEMSNQSSSSGAGGQVTVASNLPEGDAGGGDGQSASDQATEIRERTNYEVSQTERELVRGPGAVRRLTVAVLINEAVAADGTVSPRAEEELSALRELVASAVGFDEARGDVITLKAMAFESAADLGSAAPADAGLLAGLNIMQLVQLAVLAAVALVLGLFVVRPVLSSARTPAPQLAPPVGTAPAQLAVGGDVSEDGPVPVAAVGEVLPEGDAPETASDPVDRLKGLIASRQDETVQILRNWIETPDGAETR